MHVHLPKPLHGWREFVGEVGIIVIGVLIALSAEQLVAAVHWHHKVQVEESAIKTELGNDLRWALLVKQYNRCSVQFLDKFQAAVIARDAVTARKLDDMRAKVDPFPPGAWSDGTFKALLAGQIEDHLPSGRMADYSREFTWIPLQMQFQLQLYEELAKASTAKFDVTKAPDAVVLELAAVQGARSVQRGRVALADAMLEFAHENLNVAPSMPDYIAENAAGAKQCEAQLLTIAPAP